MPGRGRPDAPAAQGHCSILDGNSIVCEDARLFTWLFQSDAFPCSASIHSAGKQTPTLETSPRPAFQGATGLPPRACTRTPPSPKWKPLVQTCHPFFHFKVHFDQFSRLLSALLQCVFLNGTHVCERPRAPFSSFTPQLPC